VFGLLYGTPVKKAFYTNEIVRRADRGRGDSVRALLMAVWRRLPVTEVIDSQGRSENS
jgi:hypothetical protein